LVLPENLCRRLRQILGLNQNDFAVLLGRSYQSVQRYEVSASIPRQVLDRIEEIARDKGVLDQFAPVPVTQGTKPLDPKRSAGRDASRERLHAMLDNILDSKDPDALRAVIPNLELFAKWVNRKDVGVQREKRRA
jgi:transcriptional regulator with XRE-family HTH domain